VLIGVGITTSGHAGQGRTVFDYEFRHCAELAAVFLSHPRGVRIPAKSERRRERRVSEAEERGLLEACKLLNEPTRSMAKLTWDDVHEIRARANAGIEQREIAAAFKISRPLCSAIVRGHIWIPRSS